MICRVFFSILLLNFVSFGASTSVDESLSVPFSCRVLKVAPKGEYRPGDTLLTWSRGKMTGVITALRAGQFNPTISENTNMRAGIVGNFYLKDLSSEKAVEKNSLQKLMIHPESFPIKNYQKEINSQIVLPSLDQAQETSKPTPTLEATKIVWPPLNHSPPTEEVLPFPSSDSILSEDSQKKLLSLEKNRESFALKILDSVEIYDLEDMLRNRKFSLKSLGLDMLEHFKLNEFSLIASSFLVCLGLLQAFTFVRRRYSNKIMDR